MHAETAALKRRKLTESLCAGITDRLYPRMLGPRSLEALPSCFECGVDTFEIGEFSYMVRRDVWLAAVPWNTDGGMFDFLCIGCLEARIGRRLTAADFPGEVPMKFDSRDWRSERLQVRLRADAEVA